MLNVRFKTGMWPWAMRMLSSMFSTLPLPISESPQSVAPDLVLAIPSSILACMWDRKEGSCCACWLGVVVMVIMVTIVTVEIGRDKERKGC